MAETSIWWTAPAGGGGTGDGANPYTMAQIIAWLRRTFASGANEGVLKGYASGLVVSGAASPVSVATGAASVYGFPYESDAVVTVAIPTPSVSTRVDYIVLRASWAAQTVRITRIAGTEGAGAPALTQTPNTTYDIPLAQVSITIGGAITVTDARVFAHPNIEVSTGMLAALAVASGNIAAGAVGTAQLADGGVTAAKLAALAATPVDGWNDRRAETWVYDSATQFHVVGVDLTAVFKGGRPIRLKQGAGYLYFYVVSSSFGAGNTTVVITGGSDFSLANAAITDNWLSYIPNPDGFPEWFNWTPTIVGYSANPASAVYRFCIKGRTVWIHMSEVNDGTSNATTLTYSLPVTAVVGASDIRAVVPMKARNNTTDIMNAARASVLTGFPTLLSCFTTIAGSAWTASGGKAIASLGLDLSYEMA